MLANHSNSLPRVLVSPLSSYDADHDCACSNVMGMPDQEYRPIDSISRVSTANNVQSIPLDNDFSVFFAPDSDIPARIAVLNKPAQAIWNTFVKARWQEEYESWLKEWGESATLSTIKHLLQAGFLSYEDDKRSASIVESKQLDVWLHLTDICNLRCSYCYLPHNPIRMSEDTGRSCLNAVFRSAIQHKMRRVKLKFAGGEPLISSGLIFNLWNYGQELANETGIILDGVVLTNGYLLTKNLIVQLKKAGIRLMVSLDGISSSHDAQRHLANGEGTVERILKNIETAIDNGVRPEISVTVTNQNAQDIAATVEWILQRDLNFNLNFYRENDYSKDHDELRLEEEKIIAGMMGGYRTIENLLPMHSFIGGLLDRTNSGAAHHKTCGVGQDYLVFGPQGMVSKCQMTLDEHITDATVDDPLALVRSDGLGIINLSVDEKIGCRDCNWKYWCTGGCPLMTYRSTGRYDVKSPSCAIYKALFPEVVRLEGLRLLKWLQ